MSNKEKPPDAGLHAAVACNKPELIDSLLAEGADVNAVSRNGHTPLLSAAIRFFEKKAPFGCMELLVQAGAVLLAQQAAELHPSPGRAALPLAPAQLIKRPHQ